MSGLTLNASGGNTLVSLGNGQKLLIIGVTSSALSASNFIFNEPDNTAPGGERRRQHDGRGRRDGGRPHQALVDRMPMAVWRDGVGGALGRQRCGHGPPARWPGVEQRCCVADMPTATTTTTAAVDLRGVSKEVEADPAPNQKQTVRGPSTPSLHDIPI